MILILVACHRSSLFLLQKQSMRIDPKSEWHALDLDCGKVQLIVIFSSKKKLCTLEICIVHVNVVYEMYVHFNAVLSWIFFIHDTKEHDHVIDVTKLNALESIVHIF